MSTLSGDPYDEREQTWFKHAILRRYLLRLAVIVGGWRNTITYIDCFSGPWENKAEDYSDTSPGIAIEELRKARAKLAERNIPLKLRCLFIEKDPKAFSKLQNYTQSISDVEIVAINGELENSIDKILAFNKKGGYSNFPFVFIDPTGWGGFPMDKIAPLLQLNPGEVLINFMTCFIKRFIEKTDQNYTESFTKLYGHDRFRKQLQATPPSESEDLMVSLYQDEIKKNGNYSHVTHTPVFHPESNTTFFHLIYASRNLKGLEVFKEEEYQAVKGMEQKRADAQKRKRESGGELDLFSSTELHDNRYYEALRDKYLARMQDTILELISRKRRISYDSLFEEALTIPLVWKSDLKNFLKTLHHEGRIKFEGFSPKQLVPQLSADNFIVLTS